MVLQAASSAPLFSKPKRSIQPSQVYPYVFDALAERQRATAFISDTKVHVAYVTNYILNFPNLWFCIHVGTSRAFSEI